jgi:hypothetical protein
MKGNAMLRQSIPSASFPFQATVPYGQQYQSRTVEKQNSRKLAAYKWPLITGLSPIFSSSLSLGPLFFNPLPESSLDGRLQASQPRGLMEKQADDTYVAVSDTAKEPRSEKDVSISSLPRQHDELELAGLVAPTEEEMNTLRHVPDKIKWTAYSECIIYISLY